MFDLRCSRPAASISMSISFCPSTMATRSSSACVALNNMRFMFTPRPRALALLHHFIVFETREKEFGENCRWSSRRRATTGARAGWHLWRFAHRHQTSPAESAQGRALRPVLPSCVLQPSVSGGSRISDHQVSVCRDAACATPPNSSGANHLSALAARLPSVRDRDAPADQAPIRVCAHYGGQPNRRVESDLTPHANRAIEQ